MKIKGIVWNTLGSTMYGLNSFIMLALVSRIGTVKETGEFGIAFTTAQLLYIVGLLGLSHYQMTDYEKKYCFYDYAKIRACSCGLMLAVCFVSILALGFSGQKALFTILLSVLMLLNVVGDLYQNLFFQNNRLDLSGSALFFRTLWPLAIFTITLVVTRQTVFALCLQILCNFLITLYYIVKIAPSFLVEEPRQSWAGCSASSLLMECLPLFISLLLMNLIINASKYGIEFLMDDTAQGYYNMIFMPAQVINLCSQFIFKPMLNQYAVLAQEKRKPQFRMLLIKQLALIAAFTLVCCLGAASLGTHVLGFLYRKDLSAQVVPLVLVVLGGGIYAACQLFYYIFVIMRRQIYVSLIYILTTVLSIPITYKCIQWGRLTGAALAFVVVHIVIFVLYLGFLMRSKEV